MEVKGVMETRDDLKYKLKELGIVIPKMSEAILKLRNDVSEGKYSRCHEFNKEYTIPKSHIVL